MILKVCILTSVHPRTDSRVFEKEAKTFAQKGYETVLICADGEKNEIKDNVTIKSVNCASNRILRALVTTKKVYKAALNENADVYHLQDPELVSIGVKLVKKGYKVVYDIHEDIVDTVDDKTWIPKLLRPMAAAFLVNNEKKAANKLSAVVAATPYIADRYVNWGGKNVIFLRNFPRTNLLTEPLPFSERNIDTAYTGICLTEKRGALQMAQATKKADVVLDIYGDIRPEELKESVVSVGNPEKINFYGRVPYDVLQDAMSKIKIGFLIEHPTPNAMNALCIKMFEYMSHGIAIICSNIPLWQEIIEETGCGICVDPFDVEAVATAINEILSSPEKAEQMGINGFKAVKEVYSWEKESEKLLELYSNL